MRKRLRDFANDSLLCLAVLLIVSSLLFGCAHTPAGTFVGTVTYAASTEGCSVTRNDAKTDDGARDDGKAEMHTVTVAADGAAVCVVGGGISDNLKAVGTFILGLLL